MNAERSSDDPSTARLASAIGYLRDEAGRAGRPDVVELLDQALAALADPAPSFPCRL